MTWLIASKKKNLDTMKVLTIMMEEAARTSMRLMMFIARMTFKMVKPGPALDDFSCICFLRPNMMTA